MTSKPNSLNYTLNIDRNKWETDLLAYHLGKIGDTDLINSARHACDRCDAFFYIAYRYFLKNDTQAAIENFRKALDTSMFGSWTYTGARAMLEKLERQ
jgi:hypothetical protein